MSKKVAPNKRLIFKIIKISVAVILILFIGLILLIRSPWGQNLIVDYATNYVSKKTDVVFNIKKLYLSFSGNLIIEELYLEDQKRDTLIYTQKLEASIGILPLINSEAFNLNYLSSENLVAHIYQKDSITGFNYEFLVDAFTSPTPTEENIEPVAPKTSDSTATGMAINLGEFDLAETNLSYKDDVSGIDFKLKGEQVYLDAERTDLDNMVFDIDDVRITNTKITYNQNKAFPESEEDTTASLPKLTVKDIKIDNTQVIYNAKPDDLYFNGAIQSFGLAKADVNLNDQLIDISAIALADSKIIFKQTAPPKIDTVNTTTSQFEWPAWQIKVADLNTSNNDFTIQTAPTQLQNGVFNPEHFQLVNSQLQVTDFNYAPSNINAEIELLAFVERSGFAIARAQVIAQLNDQHLKVNNLSIKTNNNSLSGNAELSYESFAQFMADPTQLNINASLPQLTLNPKDAYYFSPTLKSNTYIQSISKNPIEGNLTASGSLAEIIIDDTNLSWGAHTQLQLSGSLKNPTEPDKLIVDLPAINFKTNKQAVNQFINTDTLQFNPPDNIKLVGNLYAQLGAESSLANLKSKLRLTSPDGSVKFNGKFQNTNTIAVDGQLNVDELDLKKILGNDKLGSYSFNTTIKGAGSNLNTLSGELSTNFESLVFNNYDYKNIEIDGALTNGEGNIAIDFNDENINAVWNNKVSLDTVSSTVQSKLQMEGINFQNINQSKNDIRAKFNLYATVQGNSLDSLQINGAFTDALAIKNNDPVLLGDINFDATFTAKTTDVEVSSNPLDLLLSSDTNIAGLSSALQQQFNYYLTSEENTKVNDSIVQPVVMKVEGELRQAPILNDFLYPDLEIPQPVSFSANFNSAEHLLKAKTNAKHIAYNDLEIDSLNINLNADRTHLDYDFGVGKLSTGALAIEKVSLNGNLEQNILNSRFKAFDDEETLVDLSATVTRANDSTTFHLQPEKLIINKQDWSIPASNEIILSSQKIIAQDFSLSRNNQNISITTDLPKSEKPGVGFEFSNFKLSTFTSLLNQEKLIAAGKLNGDFVIENPFGSTGIIANASISELSVLEAPLGKLTLEANAKTLNKYDLSLAIVGEAIDLTVDGDYTAKASGAALNFDIDLSKLQLTTIENFAEGYISETKGQLQANIALSGTSTNPLLNGKVNFVDAGLTLDAYNASFTLPNEALRLDNETLYFDNFKMLDPDQNPLTIDGKIGTEDFSNPIFDLAIKAQNISLLNSKAEDNELFYGKLNVDADATIKGDLELPVVRGNLEANKATDFTYVIPESQAELVEKKGVVKFVNKENPDAILTREDDEIAQDALLRGYDIKVKMKVARNSIFNIIVDERTGDNLRVSGVGNFDFGISPNGEMSLAGKYEVDDGHYEVNLYNLVQRKFSIAEGSNIVWRGNPFEAEMDIIAVYEVEASASGLMAAQLTGENAATSSQYNKNLPFIVYLNLDGELLTPEISFDLSMPEEERGELGGEVYTQLQQLNGQQDELNKQVFSLLVLKQFFPSSSSDGSQGGSLSIAQDNANNVLSQQLNNYSNRLLGSTGIELDFGLNSYTDYSGDTATDRTQLDVSAKKRLLNDKLIVEVGSGFDVQESNSDSQNAPLVGTVNIQYLIDDDGRWRLKAYRKNDFENIIEGQVILTGISVLFSREFNRFKYLFAQSMREKRRKERQKAIENGTLPEKDVEKQRNDLDDKPKTDEDDQKKPKKDSEDTPKADDEI